MRQQTGRQAVKLQQAAANAAADRRQQVIDASRSARHAAGVLGPEEDVGLCWPQSGHCRLVWSPVQSPIQNGEEP